MTWIFQVQLMREISSYKCLYGKLFYSEIHINTWASSFLWTNLAVFLPILNQCSGNKSMHDKKLHENFQPSKNEDKSMKTSAFEQHHWIIFYSIFHLYLKLCLPNLLEIIIYLNLLSTMTLFELWHFPNFIHCQHTDQTLNKQDKREK